MTYTECKNNGKSTFSCSIEAGTEFVNCNFGKIIATIATCIGAMAYAYKLHHTAVAPVVTDVLTPPQTGFPTVDPYALPPQIGQPFAFDPPHQGHTLGGIGGDGTVVALRPRLPHNPQDLLADNPVESVVTPPATASSAPSHLDLPCAEQVVAPSVDSGRDTVAASALLVAAQTVALVYEPPNQGGAATESSIQPPNPAINTYPSTSELQAGTETVAALVSSEIIQMGAAQQALALSLMSGMGAPQVDDETEGSFGNYDCPQIF